MRVDATHNEPSEPVDYLAEYRERQILCRDVIEMLKEKAETHDGRMWAHHLPRMVDQLAFYRGLLQEEIDCYGEYRYHGIQPDEVLEVLDEDLDKLAAWLMRMTRDR